MNASILSTSRVFSVKCKVNTNGSNFLSQNNTFFNFTYGILSTIYSVVWMEILLAMC